MIGAPPELPGPHVPVPAVWGPTRRWSRVGECWASGYAFRAGRLLQTEALAQAFEGASPGELPRLLNDLNGSFAAVKATPDAAYAIVDHVRGIPLYCIESSGHYAITDDPLAADRSVVLSDEDWPQAAELLATLYVTGPETLVSGVRQVEAGSLLRVPHDPKESPTSVQWYAFRPNIDPNPSTNLVLPAYETLRTAVDRAVRVAGDALIAVPLSAGLDSGILARLLADSVDRERILTYTFGRPGSRESRVSREVARSLGLRWEFVPYSEETWLELARESSWPDYLGWASSMSAVPECSDLPAVRELRRRGVLPKDSVVVPGHTGDFNSGSWIPSALLRRSRGSRDDVVSAILATHYRLRTLRSLGRLLDQPTSAVATTLRDRCERSVPPTPSTMSREHLVSVAEEWCWRERQAKLIVNAVRVYESQGLRWALPWWDREVVDFWARVPLQQRIGQRLRADLATFVGWPRTSRSVRDQVEAHLNKGVRVFRVEDAAKRVRNLGRRVRKRSQFHGHPLACFALIDEEHFRRSYSGRETVWTYVGEMLLASLSPR